MAVIVAAELFPRAGVGLVKVGERCDFLALWWSRRRFYGESNLCFGNLSLPRSFRGCTRWRRAATLEACLQGNRALCLGGRKRQLPLSHHLENPYASLSVGHMRCRQKGSHGAYRADTLTC